MWFISRSSPIQKKRRSRRRCFIHLRSPTLIYLHSWTLVSLLSYTQIGKRRHDTEGHRSGDNIVWPPPTSLPPPPAPPTEALAAASNAPAAVPRNRRGLQQKEPNPMLCGVSGGNGGDGVLTLPVLMDLCIRPTQQDSLIYTQFSRTHPSSISSSIHSIYCGIHLSFYLNIFMCDLVSKDLLRRI
jgi:hypothetical protein